MKKEKEGSKKGRIWLGIAILIIAILAGIVLHTVSNMHTFTEINKKAEPYLSKTNVYKKVDNIYVDTEEWILDDLFMFKLSNKVIDATSVAIYKDGKRTTYEDVKGQKVKEITDNKKPEEPILSDVVKFSNTFEKIMTAFFSRVLIVEENGKKLYKVSGTRNANFMYNKDTISFVLYIDYDTGLLAKTTEMFYNENGKVENNEATYKIEFDKNTEDTFKIENESEFEELNYMEENE